MKIKLKYISVLTIILIVTLIFSFKQIESYNQAKINYIIKQHIKNLENQYKAMLYYKHLSANHIIEKLKSDKYIIDIFNKASKVKSEKDLNLYRKQLYTLIKKKYINMQKRGVSAFHFVFKNNTTFLRMHKPNKFLDNLTNIRKDFDFANKHQKIIRGFSSGKTTHGFRNIYPIYNKNNEYIGLIDISYPTELLQDTLLNTNNIHNHFLIKKDVFNFKQWNREDKEIKYLKSAENNDYLITLTKYHNIKTCIINNSKKLKPYKNIIDKNIKGNKAFGFAIKLNKNNHQIVSFYPISSNINKNKIYAWVVSYVDTKEVYSIEQNKTIIKLLVLLLSLVILIFIYFLIIQKKLLKNEIKEKTNSLIKLKEQEQIIQNQKKAIAISTLLNNIAHQWRQPLSVISTSASGLLVKLDFSGKISNEEIINCVKNVMDSTNYLSRTINDLNDFFNIKNLEYKEITTKDIFTFLKLKNDEKLIENNIKYISNIEDNFLIKTNKDILIKSIINIIDNSIEALIKKNINKDERFIFIYIYKENKNCIISIKDNAGGIDDKILNNIFEPYSTTKHQSIGTGLSLYMTYQIINQKLNGTIEAKNVSYKYNNKFYKGAEFMIKLYH